MEKVKINMVGGGFQHDVCSSAGAVPKYMEWDKTGGANISIHIDEAIRIPSDKSKKCHAWLLESSAIIPHHIEWAKQNIPFLEENFEYIFTHDKRLLGLSNKFKLTICNAVPYITDRKIHTKTKLISMIASNKRYCPGHNFRQLVVERYRSKIDCFGKGHNFIEKKETGLNDYYFSIATLNDYYPNYFTEILTDCFATGTIPIYWGHPFINEFFNENGIITLTDNFTVESLSPDLYFSKMEYIKENFERAINLPIMEDYVVEKYIK